MTNEERAVIDARIKADQLREADRIVAYGYTHARVSGYSYSQEYVLDWATRLATFHREVPTESYSLSQPTMSAERSADGGTLTLLGMPPLRGETFTIVAESERRALASGKLKGVKR